MINDIDMPYHDPFAKPSNIPSDDGYYKIYMRPNCVYEKLYQSYSTIVSAVEAWFNSGLKTAYASFDSIIKSNLTEVNILPNKLDIAETLTPNILPIPEIIGAELIPAISFEYLLNNM